jgi:hypothetical protein
MYFFISFSHVDTLSDFGEVLVFLIDVEDVVDV